MNTKITRKQRQTEKFVDIFILRNKRPPTYKQIQDYFGIGAQASFNRCRNFRHKMKSITLLDMSDILLYAVVDKFEGKGPDVLILHEANICKNGEIQYGDKRMFTIKLSEVKEIKRD